MHCAIIEQESEVKILVKLDTLNDECEFILGRVNRVFYQNPANFYKVVLVFVQDTNMDFFEKKIVVTGSMGRLQEESDYRFYGKIVEHPKYGKQFQVESYKQETPNSEKGLIAYLSSNQFSGIGKKTAKKIVKNLGLKALEEILTNPDILQKVPNLNKAKQKMITKVLRENHGMDKVLVRLNQWGFGSQLSVAIYDKYKDQTLEIIQKNPYQLIEDIDGIGFKKADTIARQLGLAHDAPERIQAAIIHELFQYSLTTGNTYIEAEELLVIVQKILNDTKGAFVDSELIADQIIFLKSCARIAQDSTKLFEKSLYYAECSLATSLMRLLSQKKAIKHSKKKIDQGILKIEKKFSISYGASQKKALKEAINSSFFILTGGPGTGKTTVINGIVHLFAKLNDLSLDVYDYRKEPFPISLAAPTGRAAKRMNEATNLPAVTIHRLLGLSGQERSPLEETAKLRGNLLIVDEFSMVDTWLANLLLKAIPSGMQVIFVGDKDQLPSVGPGQVLCDLLEVSDIPKVELFDIYRQGKDSSIIPLAHEIKRGRLPSDFTQKQKDRSFFAGDVYKIESFVKQIVAKAKAKDFTAQDIQILAPIYRGMAGIDTLNKMMQEIFNPNFHGEHKEVRTSYNVYRIGDKVLHLVNDPEQNVFNGDFGIITGIIYAKDSVNRIDELIIDFDGIEVIYNRNEWQKITLSYACSIHKAQGSEFKLVILPMFLQYHRMLKRNLLYTAVTRSKEILILLGEEEAFRKCVFSEDINRKTMLKKRIKTRGLTTKTYAKELSETLELIEENTYKEESDYLTMENINNEKINPMIGMEGITPYNF
ncbi:MAG: ATP-dependent RecD-like DNA helicase [Streptococcaceae bacterium]|jgi:exodeoxyribonuclease V alpha subunit|nr:ATP-dependent RecD-like DNA helicase [Streptococcaceae bacterium]